MPILLAGNGTYNHPYKVDFVEDAYVKSLVMMNIPFLQDKLPPFLENFNSELGKLSFYKLHPVVTRDLYNVVKWVEKANRIMFNHFNVKCVLYICENTTVQTDEDAVSKTFKQARKSFPLESIFIDSFPGLFVELLNYVKLRLHSGKSEIRLLLAFKRYSRSKAIGCQLRVDLMKKLSKTGNLRSAYNAAVKNQESVLFDETDNEKVESKASYVGEPTALAKKDSASDAGEGKGDRDEDKSVKVKDKKWRAFSCSIEASKLFELAIRKPRNKWKHKAYYLKSALYGTYLLFINHHGSPTAAKDLSSFFMLYAVVLALDITTLINFTFHIFMKGDNFPNFGWVFFFILFGVPYLSPIFAALSAFKGDEISLKLNGNMNAMCVCFNYPLTFLACWISGDDRFYFVVIAFMLLIKCALSFLSAKIRVYLANPRYGQNHNTIRKIMSAQMLKRNKQVEVLGVEAVTHLDNLRDDNTETKKMLMGIDPSAEMPAPRIDTTGLDIHEMRDKALEMYK